MFFAFALQSQSQGASVTKEPALQRATVTYCTVENVFSKLLPRWKLYHNPQWCSSSNSLLDTEELAHLMQNRALSFLRGNVDIVYAFFTQYFIPFYHFLGRCVRSLFRLHFVSDRISALGLTFHREGFKKQSLVPPLDRWDWSTKKLQIKGGGIPPITAAFRVFHPIWCVGPET